MLSPTEPAREHHRAVRKPTKIRICTSPGQQPGQQILQHRYQQGKQTTAIDANKAVQPGQPNFHKHSSRTSKTTAIERQQSRDKQAPRRGLPNTLCTSRTVTTTEPRAHTRETTQRLANHRGVQRQLAPMDGGKRNGGRGRNNFGIKARTNPNCPCAD